MPRSVKSFIIFCLVAIWPLSAFATNGDNLIGIDPNSRSMGGVWIATPKDAPAVAYQPNNQLSFGLALHIDYAGLDLGSGLSFNYQYGVRVGILYNLGNLISIGTTYVTLQ